MFVWLAMTTGARRGELCALRWSHVDLNSGVVSVRRAISQDGTHREEKDTKTHQHRRLALDPETVAALTEHYQRCCERAVSLEISLAVDAFVFSQVPDGSEHLVPGSVSQRFSRLAARLGIDTHLHNLRHYSATELIAAGVDVRTVAGRFGHSGGGITTLRVYAAWLAESDQRASAGLAARMRMRPVLPSGGSERAMLRPATPRELLAVELREQILSGDIPVGGHLPGIKQLARDHGLSVSTVHRAFSLLREWGLVFGEPGGRARVAEVAVEPISQEVDQLVPVANSPLRELLNLELRQGDEVVARLMADADPMSAPELRQLLRDAVRRHGGTDAEVGDYEMDVRNARHPFRWTAHDRDQGGRRGPFPTPTNLAMSSATSSEIAHPPTTPTTIH